MAEIRSSNEPEADAVSKKLPAGLYVVATPIGNLSDISKRAKEVLAGVDVVACEDTRVTGKLLNAYLIKKPMLPYHEHNGNQQRPKILDKIASGGSVALVSDAGTPLISDPGYKLVDDAYIAGLRVVAIPGPCAVVTALSAAGMPTDRFLFMGFAPNKTKARTDWFAAEKETKASLVYYESTRRLPESLRDAAAALGARPAAVCRELTKKFEEVVRGNLISLADTYATAGPPKGEVVVVIGPPDKAAVETSALNMSSDELLSTALKHMSVKSTAAFVAEITGENRKPLYKKALELSSSSTDEST